MLCASCSGSGDDGLRRRDGLLCRLHLDFSLLNSLDLLDRSSLGRASFICLLLVLLVLRVDGDLDSDGPATDLLSIEQLDRLELLLLGADVDEAKAFRFSGLSPATTNNASRVDFDAGIGEDGAELLVGDGKSEVGDEQVGLGGLASRLLASGAWGAGSPRLTRTGLLLALSICAFGGLSSLRSTFAFGLVSLGLAL